MDFSVIDACECVFTTLESQETWVTQFTHQHHPSHSDYEIMSYSREMNLSACA